jgi:hypothetical protein
MLRRCVAVMIVAGSTGVSWAQPQPAPPNLSRSQRAALQAVVRAMDTATAVVETSEHEWPLHVLRASDGSHYVAFSVLSRQGLPANRPLVLYVRLATRSDPRMTSVAERSAVAEWLAGQTPTPALRQRGIAFGDMPTFGAGAIAARGVGPQSLQLLELERERARERREAEERERKAALEGAAGPRGPRPLLPFEDFDVGAVAAADPAGAVMLQRSLTAGPGDYDLLVGWADPEARDIAATVRIVRRRLSLAPASTVEFSLSGVILADDVTVRERPLSAAEQSARPYSIGPMDISPARDHSLTNDERLALVVQVINARGALGGKPDVAVGFRLFRRTGDLDEVIGSLAPQIYNETTLPADFDVAKRHPIFAAVAVPLRPFKRGDYRLEVAANDRIAGIGVTTDAAFTIVGSPPALLREAPALVAPFRRDDLLQTIVLEEFLTRLQPASPSSALAAALDAARARRFVELIREDAVSADETVARHSLRTLALYALGETATMLAAPLAQILKAPGSPAAAQILMGATRALDGNDREAIAAWDAAIAAGADAGAIAPLLVDALLRQGNATRAVELAQRAASVDPGLVRRLAAAHLAAGRHADALRSLDARLAQQPDDPDAQWLALHALFAGFVNGSGPGSDAAGRARIGELAARYAAAMGPHAALAAEWAAATK